MQCNGNGRFANFHLMHVQHLKKKKNPFKGRHFFFFLFLSFGDFFHFKEKNKENEQESWKKLHAVQTNQKGVESLC